MSRRHHRGFKNYILYSPYSIPSFPSYPRRRRSGITESDQTSGPLPPIESEEIQPSILLDKTSGTEEPMSPQVWSQFPLKLVPSAHNL